ncbi:MAG: hypothetical protein QOF29_3459 [bacterium]|jgi:hypothetical protein|nr:hypothetical protein [Solirubrobacteraceae bacterium]
MESEATNRERLLAAIGAALLGSQGSAVWARTAELLLLSSHETQRHHQRALREIERMLGEDAVER